MLFLNCLAVWADTVLLMLLQKNPVWQALLDDAEARHAIVRNASAAELFPNMTELHLMQANRHPPSPEPQPNPHTYRGHCNSRYFPKWAQGGVPQKAGDKDFQAEFQGEVAGLVSTWGGDSS